MRFRCAGVTDSCIDGLEYSPALVVFFQGCTVGCPGCHNPGLQPLDGGSWMDTDEVVEMVSRYPEFYRGVVFSGGDPMEQPDALLDLIRKLDALNVRKVLYTGRMYEELPDEIRSGCDIVVDGPYIRELATSGFPASSNQRVIRRC